MESLAQKGPFGSYARSHGDLIAYWKDVQDALNVPFPTWSCLQNGFLGGHPSAKFGE